MTPIAKNLVGLIAKDNTSHIHPRSANLFSYDNNEVFENAFDWRKTPMNTTWNLDNPISCH